VRRLLWILAVLPAVLLAAGDTAARLNKEILRAGLDPDECYRVREIPFGKEDLRLYLTEGYVIFGNPVRGRRLSAVFSGEVEGGDGELLVMPPTRSERLSLATFTDSPNLDEHFSDAVMIFSDDTAETLRKLILSRPRVRKSPEMGNILQEKFSPVVSNFCRSFSARLIYDVLSGHPPSVGFFYAAIQGRRYGGFDAVYDPTATEQIRVGQVRYRENQSFFDVWTSFRARSFRNGTSQPPPELHTLSDYRIEATLEKDLSLHAVTRATMTIQDEPAHVLFFDLSPRVQVDEVLVDGEVCEIWQRESLRANLFRRGAGLFLVIPPAVLEVGRHSIEFRHHGQVVAPAGEGVYFVGARSSWYPYNGVHFSHFDVTFRYPEGLNLIFAGKVVEDHTDGEWHITRRKTENPIRIAGFNVGEYEEIKVSRPGFEVEVYANRHLEEALEPKARLVIVPRGKIWNRGARESPSTLITTPPRDALDPTARLGPLANEVADAFEFMASFLGPPPTSKLMVSPIPGNFGQGFPGLLYISTVAYLEPENRPQKVRDEYQEYFYSEILHAHETAHQWWGNTVTGKTYRDGWLMEALANYTALLVLEKRKGAEALHAVLDVYRDHLLTRTKEGKILDSAGPICWGPRLDSSQVRAWQTITYEKGSWIIHMLRRRMGDDKFLEMLGDLCRLYRFQPLTIEEFRKHAARYLPKGIPDATLEGFFDQWVYDIGIPRLKFSYQIRGKAPRVRLSGTVSQSDVADSFSACVPIEVHFAEGKPVTKWLRTGAEPEPFRFTFRRRPVRVVFNPGDSLLVRK